MVPIHGPKLVPAASEGICCHLGLFVQPFPLQTLAGHLGLLISSGEVVMKSPSRPPCYVTGQVKGLFAPAEADVIPGKQFSTGGRLQPWLPAGLLVACILFCLQVGRAQGGP